MEQSYHEQVVAQHERELAAAEAKVDKLRDHLAGAEQEVEAAKVRLADAEAADHDFVEPTEHVTAEAQ